MNVIGSGIILAGYVDTTAGIIVCRDCRDSGDGVHMESIYSPDVNEDTPPCFSCGKLLG